MLDETGHDYNHHQHNYYRYHRSRHIIVLIIVIMSNQNTNLKNLQNQSRHNFTQNKTHTRKHQTQNRRRLSPIGNAPVNKAHKSRTRWYRGPFLRFSNTRF